MTPDRRDPAPIDVVVLTGFLGSGKTTLLSAYLTCSGAADTAIIVNEVGEIGLDEARAARDQQRRADGDACQRMRLL